MKNPSNAFVIRRPRRICRVVVAYRDSRMGRKLVKFESGQAHDVPYVYLENCIPTSSTKEKQDL